MALIFSPGNGIQSSGRPDLAFLDTAQRSWSCVCQVLQKLGSPRPTQWGMSSRRSRPSSLFF